MSREDGGNAFPSSGEFCMEGFPESGKYRFTGMSLRDWFAGQALGALIETPIIGFGRKYAGDPAYSNEMNVVPSELAKGAYKIADAMLKERVKNE